MLTPAGASVNAVARSEKRELRELIEVQRPDVLVSDIGLRDDALHCIPLAASVLRLCGQ